MPCHPPPAAPPPLIPLPTLPFPIPAPSSLPARRRPSRCSPPTATTMTSPSPGRTITAPIPCATSAGEGGHGGAGGAGGAAKARLGRRQARSTTLLQQGGGGVAGVAAAAARSDQLEAAGLRRSVGAFRKFDSPKLLGRLAVQAAPRFPAPPHPRPPATSRLATPHSRARPQVPHRGTLSGWPGEASRQAQGCSACLP